MNRLDLFNPLYGALILVLSHAAVGGVFSDFSSADEGWRAGDPSGVNPSAGQVIYQATGGTPGGFIAIEDLLTGSATSLRVYAPATFLGDLRAYDGGTLSFDGKLVSGTWNPGTFGRVEIGSGATVAMQTPDPAPNPTSSWQNYSVPMTADGFGLTQGAWTALLSSVDMLRINVEDNSGMETTGIDNVVLVPEPGSVAVLLLGCVTLLVGGRPQLTGRAA